MAANPLGNPKFRAFDSNGDPLAGGKLHTYSAGTTTPRATYTTRAGSVANANPVVLDANGEADVWLAPAVDYKFVLKNSSDVTQWTVDSFPSAAEASVSTDVVATDPGGRLTLTSGTPVTTDDLGGATTIYYVPYKSDKVPLYDGTAWALHSIGSSGLSQAVSDATKSPAAVVLNTCYDLFVWSDSGTIRLSRGPAWFSVSLRGTGAGTTELERVNGRYVNRVSISNGPGAQRGLYVGTVRTGEAAQIRDALDTRHVWNMYNRVRRSMRALDSTNSWNYTTDTFRFANGDSANALDLVVGIAEDTVTAVHMATVSNEVPGALMVAAIGLDLSTVAATGCLTALAVSVADEYHQLTAHWEGHPGIGRHFLARLEKSSADGTTTWYGDANAPTRLQTGIHGACWA